MNKFRYLIIGGGVAAGYAAQEFVEQGVSPGELGILSADHTLPYDRPPLSKAFLRGERDRASVLINPPEFYSDHGIVVRLATVVGRVDLEHKLAYTDDETISFDRLMIATGARPRRFDLPGSDLRNIFYLRRMDQSLAIQAAAHNIKNAVVIGGSFIGMEVAASLRQLGVAVDMVYMEDHVWEAIFTPPMSAYFENYLQAHGVGLYPGSQVKKFLGAGQVTAVQLQNGKILPADMVVAGIGVLPNTEVFAQSPLKIDDGILVNRFLETNMPDVYAVGDVARYHDVIFDRPLRLEHWDNALAQSKLAARGLLGKREKFVHVPYFFSDVFDLSYEYWGDHRTADRVIYRGEVDQGSFSTWWLEGECLVAAFVLNRPDEERELAQELIRSGQPVTEGELTGDLEAVQAAGD